MTQKVLFEVGPFTVTATGLTWKGQPTFKEWAAFGSHAIISRSGLSWAIGDWLVFGETHSKQWGDKYDYAMQETGLPREQLMQFKRLSARFPPEKRRTLGLDQSLTWSHFRAVAALDDKAAGRLLKLAADKDWTKDELRDRVREVNRSVRRQLQIWPRDTYGLILADPPWNFEAGSTDPTRQIENQYPTMTVEELAALKVADLAAPNCVLYLWATSAKVVAGEAVEVVRAWGFEGRSTMVWVKDTQGMGYWARQRHEHIIIATKGSPMPPDESLRPDSIIAAPRREHSRKPDELYDIIERCYPKVPRIELFATHARKGWATWGNERLAATG